MEPQKKLRFKEEAVRHSPEQNPKQQDFGEPEDFVCPADFHGPEDFNGPADFEKAIAATGFGKFNVILLIISIPAAWASVITSAATSYIPPFAACDLHLSLQDKGLLNAIVFAGMVSSAFIWGFFSDAFGRKRIMLGGFFFNVIFVILAGFSQNFSLVLFAKFMDGVTMCGPYAIFTSCLSEFHSLAYRARVMLFFGILMTSSFIVVPALGLGILTSTIEANLFDGGIILHSWNFFILVSSFASILTVIGIIYLPESPKYLMTMGENEKALEVFKKVYSMNSGKHPDTYPVKELVHENMKGNECEGKSGILMKRKKIDAIREGLHQFKILFMRPHGFVMLQVCAIHFCMFTGTNMLSIWFPQILSTINDYTTSHDGQDSDLCTMLESGHSADNESTVCTINMENTDVFYNAMYPPGFVILAYVVATALINKIGKKNMYFVFGLIAGIMTMCIYFSPNTLSIIALTSVGWSMSSVSAMIMISMVVDLFPTTLRAMAVSLTMVSGRLGTMLGNLMFPYLLQSGCLAPFLTIGLIIVLATITMTTLPRTDMKALE